MNSIQALGFGPYRLSSASGPLCRGEEVIALRPKTLEVLWHLASHAGEVVSKQALLDAVWAQTVVSEIGPAVCVREIRRALGDDPSAPRFIQTVHRRGYRFIAPLSHAVPGSASIAATFVGRGAELEWIQDCYARARDGQRCVLFVTGEAGIGKTTLIETWAQTVATEARVGCGQCIDHVGVGEAYLPWLEALTALCRGTRGETAIGVLRRVAPSWLYQLPSLLDEAERQDLHWLAASADAERMQRELADALEALTAEQPVVVVLEDLHWCDPSTVEALALLARRQAAARLMVIGTYRPVDLIVQDHPLKPVKEELQVHRQCVDLALGYLDQPAVAAYLAQIFPSRTLTELVAPIHQRTDGHPLYMVTLVDYLAQQEWQDDPPARWENLATTLPTDLQEIIEMRLAALGGTEQQVLEAASVVGSEFTAAAVSSALGVAEEQVEATCETLGRHGQLIADAGLVRWPDGTVSGRYVFGHALYPEVLYGRIGSARRARWHEAIGRRLELGYSARSAEVAATLARHFEQCRDYALAVRYLQQAAETALDRHAQREASERLHRALALLDHLPATAERDRRELALRVLLGPLLIALTGYGSPLVKACYERARELCRAGGQTEEQFQVIRGLTAYHIMRANYPTAAELGELLLELANHAEPASVGLTLQGHLMQAITSYLRGEFRAAHEHSERTVSLYDRERHHSHAAHYGYDPGVMGLNFEALSLWHRGYPGAALAKTRDALALAESLSHPFSLAQCLIIAAELHQLRRETLPTIELSEAALVLADEHGFPDVRAAASCHRGWALAMEGRTSEGLDCIAAGLAMYQATGVLATQTSLCAVLAEAHAMDGRIEEGLSIVTEALTRVEATRECFYEVELLRIKSLLLQQHTAAAASEADACLRRALHSARRQQTQGFELRAAKELAQLWASQGDNELAASLLEPVYNRFSEGFDTADLQQARELIDIVSANGRG